MEDAVVCAHAARYMRMLKVGVFILDLLTLCLFPFSYTDTVHAEDTISRTWQAGLSCAGPSQLNSESLLVVLLDRSGSLVTGPTTDPEGYSGSVTNALADLWPGNIAVIPFGNDRADKLGKGVFAHSSTSDLTTLKDLVKRTFPPPNDADTPLGLAIQSAKMLFEQQGITACSRVVIVTDGQPTGPGAMVDEIHNQFLPWFKSQGIPVNAFGLKLDTSAQDGRNADILLREITSQTNGIYTPVLNAEDLASSVIGLYSNWRGLSFARVNKDQQGGNYPIAIDRRVTQATIITFHSTGVQVGTLERRSGNIPGNQLITTTDTHYQIDSLVPPILSDTYTIGVGSDPAASVYALVDSKLKVEFTNMASAAYTGQVFTIKAHFIDDHGSIIPQGQTFFTVTVIEIINGKTVVNTIDLRQLTTGSDIFVADYSVPASSTKPRNETQEVGSLQIEMEATYDGAIRSTSITIPLYVPKGANLPCNQGFVTCVINPYLSQIIGMSSFLGAILLLVVLLWRCQPEPYGYLISKTSASCQVRLNKRGFGKKLLRRDTISADEIMLHPDGIGGFSFGFAKICHHK